MFTGKLLGQLTLQFQQTQPTQQVEQFISILEVGIPLLEGGLLYHGAFSRLTDDSVSDLSLFVDNSLIKSVDFEKISPEGARPPVYQIRIGQRGDKSANYLTVSLHEHPEDPQQFFGLVSQSTSQVTFTYKDINEPITIGTIAVIAIGVGGVLCASTLIIGLISEGKCDKKTIKVKYGFSRGSLGIPFPSVDCEVTCL